MGRCDKAWVVFNKSKRILMNSNATMRNRLEDLWAIVGAVITANSGSRTWGDAQLNHIDRSMLAMMRRTKAPKRLQEEHYWDWKKWSATAARNQMRSYTLHP